MKREQHDALLSWVAASGRAGVATHRRDALPLAATGSCEPGAVALTDPVSAGIFDQGSFLSVGAVRVGGWEIKNPARGRVKINNNGTTCLS